MNVSLNKLDSANAIIKINVGKEDYESKVEKALKNFRQKANIPGFRKGMAPMGMLKKMYGKSVQAEEINRLVSEELFGYIRNNKINILGEPLPNESEQKMVDFENDEEFEFCFDLGLAPEMDVEPSKKDKITYYDIAVSDEDVEAQVNSFADRFGKYDQVEVVEETDMVKGSIVELDDQGNIKENGLSADGSIVMPKYFKAKDEVAKFVGKKSGEVVKFNLKKACEGNEMEMGHILQVDKSIAGSVESDFNFTIVEITRHAPAALDQALFDMVYEAGTVHSIDEFRAEVRKGIEAQLAPESDYKFWLDAQAYFDAKLKDIVFPDAFLKRFLLTQDQNKTAEQIDAEYPEMMKGMAWHLLKEKFAKDFEIKVEAEDLKAEAVRIARMQFAQYGMTTAPDDLLANYAENMLKDEKQRRNLIDRAVENKLIDALKERVTLSETKISQGDFAKLFEA